MKLKTLFIILSLLFVLHISVSDALINDVYGIFGDATPKNTPDAVYITYYHATGGNFKYAKSTDIGVTWTPGFIQQTDDVGAWSYSNVIDPETVTAVYFNNTSNTLQFIKTVNGGASWSMPVDIDSGAVSYLYSSLFAIDFSNIFVSYYDSTAIDLKYGKTSDGGTTWITGIIDSSIRSGTTTDSSIYAYDTSNVWVSYFHSRAPINTQDLAVASTVNGGTGWTLDQIDTAGTVGLASRMYSNSSTVLNVVYLDSTNVDQKFARSINGGLNYTLSILNSGVSCPSFLGCTSISGVGNDNIYVAFGTLIGGTNVAAFAKSTDGGSSWVITQLEATNPSYLSIDAFNTNYIFISYKNASNNLRTARSIDGGDTWTIQTIENIGATGGYTVIGAK